MVSFEAFFIIISILVFFVRKIDMGERAIRHKLESEEIEDAPKVSSVFLYIFWANQNRERVDTKGTPGMRTREVVGPIC